MFNVTEFPICYIMKLKSHNVYVPHTNFAIALYDSVISDFYKNPNSMSSRRYIVSNIDLAKRWSTLKKLKTAIRDYKTGAKHYIIIGSDHSIIEVESL